MIVSANNIFFKVFSMLLIVFGFMNILHAANINTDNQDIYTFIDQKQTAQFTHLLNELRCLVCPNQDLADSNAPLAKDLRNEVYDLVISGKSDAEVVDYLTQRYGDFILFKPPVKLITLLLWFGPLLFSLLGIIIFFFILKRRKHV